jgi:hypothetical protein
MISQVFLNSHLFLQGALHIVFSIIQLTFNLYYLPFKERSIMISNLISEFSLAIILISSYLFLFDISDQLTLILEQLCTYTMMVCVVGQLLISINITVQKLKLLYKKIFKAQVVAFLMNATNSRFSEVTIR